MGKVTDQNKKPLQWKTAFLKTQIFQNRLQRFKKNRRVQSDSEKSQMVHASGSLLKLSTKTGTGKITDAGYDRFVCYYAEIPISFDVSFSADITLQSFLKVDHTTYQEGFGLFFRDTMDPDPLTGYHYSNMAAVGGYYGRWNVFGRSGVHESDIENVRNFFLFEKPSDVQPYQTNELSPRHVRLRLEREGACIRAYMQDETGQNLLKSDTSETFADNKHFRFSCMDDGGVVLPLPDEFFSERDNNHYYIGFFSAGSTVLFDTEKIQVTLKERPDRSRRKDALFASPSGSCFGYGTIEQPYDLQTAINCCGKGQRIILQSGRYHLKEDIIIRPEDSGEEAFPKRLESSELGKSVLDFGRSSHALLIQGNHWKLKGFTVTNGMGIQIQGSWNHLQKCIASQNLETGILIRHKDITSEKDAWPSHNIVEDCISFENRDLYECNADGFACKLAAGEGNQFIRCLSYLNADDGFDLFAKNRLIGAVELKECRSFLNGYKKDSSGTLLKTSGNGTGFKLGGSGLGVSHSAVNCDAFGNRGMGFTSNSNPQMNLINCRAGNNGGSNFSFYFTGQKAVIRKNIKNCSEQDISDFDPISWLQQQDLLVFSEEAE